jgi:hypothetical protein
MPNKPAIAEQEESFQTEDSEQPIPPADIVAYNELRSCADLFRLHSSGKLEIQPDFQREVVWKQDDQSRFIDSLVKQLPIPSMCFSLDYRTQKWKVIDGLQRMSSIIRFLSEKPEWQLSDLPDIHPLLRKATNTTLRNGNDEQRRVFALVEDVSIPVTVIRCDYTQRNHMRYLFTIFHRLNSGGVRLTNQEIRNCIFTGPFNDVLKRFDNQNTDWKAVKKRIWGGMDRYRSVEVLLRVLAFGDRLTEYDGNLARFLNDYMQAKHALPSEAVAALEQTLSDVASRFRLALADETRRKLPLLLVEAVLVALYVNHQHVNNVGASDLKRRYNAVKKLPTFADSARYAVSSVDNVKTRLGAAIAGFSAES